MSEPSKKPTLNLMQVEEEARTHHLLDHIYLIMVNTTLPANIGAGARAMKTMGLKHLILVAPKTFPSPDATALSAGASDILDSVQIVETLEEAIAQTHLVFATSARSRSIPWPLLDVRDASQLAISEIAKSMPAPENNADINQSHQPHQPHKVAIVFGREDRGLTNEELSLANYHLTIPVNSDYGVLNVAAAMQVISYELRMSALEEVKSGQVQASIQPNIHPNRLIDNTSTLEDDWDEPLVDHGAMNLFYPHFEAMLHDIEFLNPNNPRVMPLRIRRLFGRIRLDQMEYNLLRGIFGRVQSLVKGTWQPDQKPKISPSNTPEQPD